MQKTFYIIDDHEMLRHGTASFIQASSDWMCTGSAGSQKKALADFAAAAEAGTLPALAISDLNFFGEDTGFSFIQKLHALYPTLKIIVYSMFFSPGAVQVALQNGASGYISKNAATAELLACMEAVLSGQNYVERNLMPRLEAYNSFTDSFTRREKQVMEMLLRHYSNEQIAAALGLKRRAVENYISSIYEKTGINDKATLLKRFDTDL